MGAEPTETFGPELADASGVNAVPVERTRRVLRARARALARPPAEPEESSGVELVVFSVAGESYGIELSRVREVMHPQPVVRVPHAPQWVAGVMSYRGRVLAVIDLCHFLAPGGSAVGKPAEGRRLVVVEAPGMTFALLIDTLAGAVRAEPVPASVPAGAEAGARPSFVQGMAPGMVAVLDVAALAHYPGFRVNSK